MLLELLLIVIESSFKPNSTRAENFLEKGFRYRLSDLKAAAVFVKPNKKTTRAIATKYLFFIPEIKRKNS